MDRKTILVVDDDINICELLDMYLSKENFELIYAHDGSSALDILQKTHVDLVLLDIMLPVINGWEVCKLIKSKWTLPVIMITARDALDDKIMGFDAGADDYVVKPFQTKEVIARIKARLKNYDDISEASVSSSTNAGTDSSTVPPALEMSSEGETDPQKSPVPNQDGVLSVDNLTVDIHKYEVYKSGQLIELKPKEVQLLYFLLKNKNIVFSRDQLLEKVWNYSFSGDTRTVDAHIKSLRKKLNGSNSCWRIKTIWGVGYKFEVR